MTVLAQQILLGLLLGGLYGLAAAGLSLVFGVLRVLNVAHGELIMLGGYGAFWLFALLGLDPFAALLVVIPGSLLLGAGLYLALFGFVVRAPEESRIKNSLLVGFGLGWMLGGPARDTRSVLAMGTAQRNIAAALVVGGQNFDEPRVVVMVVVVAIVGLLVLMPLGSRVAASTSRR